jgi:hypothetical protein
VIPVETPWWRVALDLPTSRQRSAGADASNKVPTKSLALRKALSRRWQLLAN